MVILKALLVMFMVNLICISLQFAHGREAKFLKQSKQARLLSSADTGTLYVGREKLSLKEREAILDGLDEAEKIITVNTFDNIGELKTFKKDKKFVYLQGYKDEDDGGEAFFVIEITGQPKSDNFFDGILIVPTGDKNIILKRIHTGNLDIRAVGAKGDGVTDDTIEVRRILDTRMDVMTECQNCVFLVGPSKDSNDARYTKTALVVYSNQKLDLRGATLRLKDNSNAFLLSNNAIYIEGTSDNNIHLKNIIFDGNVSNQKTRNIGGSDRFSPTLILNSINKSVLRNIEVRNYYGAGIYITYRIGHLSNNVELDEIHVSHGLGPGVHIEGENFAIGKVEIEGTRPFMEGEKPVHYWGAYPNSMAARLYNSTIRKIIFKDCSWGFKLQDGSKNVHIASIDAEGVRDIQAVKFQGADDKRGYWPNDSISVDSIVSSNNNYNGLYIIYNTNIRIKKYIGNNNGLSYKSKIDPWHLNAQNFYDVLVIRSDATIDEIESYNSSVGVLYSEESGKKTVKTRQFGKILVRSGAMSNAVYVRDSSNDVGELDLGEQVDSLTSAVYFDRVPVSANRANVFKVIRVAKELQNINSVCHGDGAYKCSYIKMGQSKLFGIENGSRIDR